MTVKTIYLLKSSNNNLYSVAGLLIKLGQPVPFGFWNGTFGTSILWTFLSPNQQCQNNKEKDNALTAVTGLASSCPHPVPV